ncbi:hypothetical protein F2P56_032842 [Juglans regia]|uniref:RNase H type-1 domain-containing protein n=2 Tax=Juglans regia TaxID=51240 RepID=A0A833TGG8_JUGRE|nr:uncharacterized protein LOC109020516 [Juglans regia]KAF5447276.1 hypothetical protein F2P56_032842 [Juglans regia]
MKIFEEKCVSAAADVGNALAMQQSFKELKCKPVLVVKNYCRSEFPPPGSFKLNVDGALSSNGLIAGVGVILRDSKGEVMMSAAKKEQGGLNAVEIEGLAILHGLQFSNHLGIHNLVIESDSLLVVNEFARQGSSKAAIGNTIKQAKELMRRFSSCVVQYANRSFNAAAHSLAKFGLCVKNISLWWGSFPDVISNILWIDSLVEVLVLDE